MNDIDDPQARIDAQNEVISPCMVALLDNLDNSPSVTTAPAAGTEVNLKYLPEGVWLATSPQYPGVIAEDTSAEQALAVALYLISLDGFAPTSV